MQMNQAQNEYNYKLIMPTMPQLETQAQGLLDQVNRTNNTTEKICILWSTIINPALELVKAITGPKVDRQIERIQEAVNSVCSGQSDGVQKFCAIWPTLKPMLHSALVRVHTNQSDASFLFY
jgi:hypothetical protein